MAVSIPGFFSGRLLALSKGAIVAFGASAVALVLSLSGGSAPAKADGIYFSGSGFGIGFGTGGIRGGYFYGAPFGYYGGYYGPPYRPYGAPYYYNPYDRRGYPYRSRVYVAPPLTLSQPQRVPYTKTGLAPFTPEWVAYCSRKYRTFNPNTGTFLAYSGKYRFCR